LFGFFDPKLAIGDGALGFWKTLPPIFGVALYLNPPHKALVLCLDEKSQIQALERSQPGLPIKKGRCGTMTHDYRRHSTTTLFAALNVLDGTVIGECMPRHRHREYLKFLRKLDRELPNQTLVRLLPPQRVLRCQ